MKRLLFITTSFETGAIPNILLDLAPFWRGEGWDCVFLALEPLPEDQESVQRCRALGFPLHSLNVGPKSVFLALVRLRRAIRQVQPDLISTHLGRADIYTPWVKGRVPMVTTHHNVRQHHGSATLWGYRISDRRVAWRTGVSQACNESFLQGEFLRAPHSVIPNPVDPQRLVARRTRADLLSQWGWAEPVQLLVTVARLASQKGHPDLLEAVGRLRKRHPQLRLAIAGEGPLRQELESLADQRGLSGIVTFLGRYRDVADLYAAADGMVLASHWEGFGLVILEAWLGGCPVVASSLPAVREFVVDGQNGLLFEPGDVDGLVAALARLLDHPQAARALAADGRRVADERFGPSVVARQYSELFRQILDGSS